MTKLSIKRCILIVLIVCLILPTSNTLSNTLPNDILNNGDFSATELEKISPWLRNETIKWLQVDPYNKISVIIWVNESYLSEYGINQIYVADKLVAEYNATITMMGEPVLHCIIADIPVIEVEKLALQPLVESLGSGTYPIYHIRPNEAPVTTLMNMTSYSYTASSYLSEASDSYKYTTLQNSVATINAPNVWAMGYSGQGIKIAIIDSGINTTLPDGDPRSDFFFPNGTSKIVYERDFTNDGNTHDFVFHGTWVAITAAGSNNYDHNGTAPEALILNIKVINRTGEALPLWVVNGIKDAVEQGANVINLSIGGPGSNGTDEVSKATDDAVKKGVVVVAAAGNAGPGSETINSPGCAFNVITVGAVAVNNT